MASSAGMDPVSSGARLATGVETKEMHSGRRGRKRMEMVVVAMVQSLDPEPCGCRSLGLQLQAEG